MSTKKTMLILSALSFFAIAGTAFAQGFVPLAPISGLTDQTSATSIISQGSFANFFNNLYKYCIGLSAVLAVIMIIWGGLEYATQDVPGSKQNGKEKIQQAILGLVLVLSPVLVFSIINPSILSLSLNFDRINTAVTPAPAGTIIQPGQQVACSSSLIIGQSANTSDTVCVQRLQQACRDAGGIPKLTGQTVISVQCDPRVNAPAVGTSITANQCANLTSSVSGSLQPTVLPASTVANCAGATGALSPAAQGYNSCADITGGGICFYNN